MKGKSTEFILKICRENEGKILSSTEVLKLFGYSTKSNIVKLKIYKFLRVEGYEHPSQYWKICNWVVVNRKQVVSLEPGFWYYNFRRIGQNYLYPKEKVPWWMLKEYGGNI
jgi:hypothetical protein